MRKITSHLWPITSMLYQSGIRAARHEVDRHYAAYQRAFHRRQQVKPGSGAERQKNCVLEKKFWRWQEALERVPPPQLK
jgi:hypothetical protein